MSGTSLDGVDAVCARFDGPSVQVQHHVHRPFDPTLRMSLASLNSPGTNELHRAALAANALARCYAEVTTQLLRETGLAPHAVAALGAHGQTVRHRPGEFDQTGYTWQLLNGALLAELSGIDVVCDFRSRDVAAGGQGAPLVPAFHAAVFGSTGCATAVLNLGGIGNITLIDTDGGVRGFDCGPGNALLDLWVRRHGRGEFDQGGAWAAQGQVDRALLAQFSQEPFLHRQPPKSTGLDLFNADWLDRQLGSLSSALSAVDVQATLAEFTAQAAAQALQRHLPAASRLLVCGGGALNDDLMRRLGRLLPELPVRSTDALGMPPMVVEAAAFAWLAHVFLAGAPGNMPAVTGALGARPLGALYPASAHLRPM